MWLSLYDSVEITMKIHCTRYQLHRQGSVYVAVLGVALIIAVMAIGAMAVQRTQRHMVARQQDLVQARINALAGIEMGRLRIQKDSAWRTTFSNGIWEQDVAVPTGTYTLEGVDPTDGDLTNDELQTVTLGATGTSGTAIQKIAATFQPDIVPLNCLEVAVVGGSATFDHADVTCDQTIASNTWMWANSANVHSYVEATQWILGWTYWQGRHSYAKSRDLPDSDTVFDYYVNHGTSISINDLPLSPGSREMSKILLSPNLNPFGTGQTNAAGVYVIDCLGQDVKISESRIVGTIVLLNAGAGTEVKRMLNWAPAVTNYPALLVQGNIQLRFESGHLLKERDEKVNFNPIGTPYAGSQDDDQVDEYPTELKGLVYVSGSCLWKDKAHITGVVLVGGGMTFDQDPVMTYSSVYYENPPPGFYSIPLKPVAGSWRRVVN